MGNHQSADHHAKIQSDLLDAYQGAPGTGGAPPGDLYLEIQFRPHPICRVEGRDVHFELPISPWEAALGGTVNAPTPLGPVQLSIPAGSVAGRKLRLKGRGLPGALPGDLYAVLAIVLPQAVDDNAREAWQALAREFADFNPRVALET